jgi:hypothetical protein
MKQTAVEWLYNKFSTCTSDELVGNINNWFNEAKEMDKAERAKEYLRGFEDGKEYIKNRNL